MPQGLRSILRNHLGIQKQTPPVKRSDALQEEIQFWRDWFVTGGLEWPQDFQQRFNPDQPIQDHVAIYIDRLKEQSVHILDVGSGPITKLGMKHPSKQLIITATDLLAHEYDRLLAELKIEPPLRTIYADAERLVEQFGQNTFDIVYGRNCIDHMIHPLRAIEQMLAVSKPQGYVVLYHEENEGQSQRYRQLHQWNFTCENAAFVIRDKRGQVTNVTKKLEALCEIECIRDGDKILTSIHKKVV